MQKITKLVLLCGFLGLLLGCSGNDSTDGETAVSPTLIVFYTDN